MAHFAKLNENNIVVFVTAGRNEDDGLEDELSARTGDVYKQTSYNTYAGVHILGGTPFRKNYASLGYFYDLQRDAFIPPKPYASWVLNETTCLWNAPVAMPSDVGTSEAPKMYTWNEETIGWDLITT